jgi:NAD(P)-dependent dehydrogenase (short-subunit alcohol dehydrogenase family)
MLLEGKTVLVSGVGVGLGTEIAATALRDGANVVIGARTADRLQCIAHELDPTGSRVSPCRADITSTDDCEAIAAHAVERFGRLDVLVNLAALDNVMGGLMDTDHETWRKVLETNVVGSMEMTRAAVPHLKERGGSVVFIGSQSMYHPQVMQAAYASSKAALVGASVHLARELGAFKIRVNTVVATWMWGPIVEGYFEGVAREQGITVEQATAPIREKMLLGEIPKDDDVADAVAFLASDRARMITGQTIFVNAGEYLSY